MTTLTTILAAIPLWVWPLFLGLAALGGRAARDRSAPVLLVYALPLLGLLGLNRAQGLGEGAVALFVLAWAAGAALGWAAQPRWTLSRSARRVELSGEWWTMAAVMTLFWGNFALGLAEGLAPGATTGGWVPVAFALVAGAVSGTLAGRALRVALWPRAPQAAAQM